MGDPKYHLDPSVPPKQGRKEPMSSRKLDELASDIDDAKTTVDELQEVRDDKDRDEKLDELHETLEDASDTLDELDSKNDE
jgi:hypothetical protein